MHYHAHIFQKQPSIIEFVQFVEKESCHQAQKLKNICSEKRHDPEEIWVLEITDSYVRFKEGFFNTDSDQCPLRKRKKERQSIKKTSRIVPKTRESIKSEVCMKHPAMADLNDNGGCHLRHTSKVHRKSLYDCLFWCYLF